MKRAFLSILPRTEIRVPPLIQYGPVNQKLIVNEMLVLNCSLMTPPTEITWQKDGIALSHKIGQIRISGEPFVYHLYDFPYFHVFILPRNAML